MESSNGNNITIDSTGKQQLVVVEEKTIAEKYTCSTCNKSFTSHQALGGHRSSHNKLKMNIVNHDHDNNNNVNNNIIINGPNNNNSNNLEILRNNVVDVDRSHVCKVCDKSFSSGQALGGHKRSHSGDHNRAAVPKFVFDFDLNKIPESQDGGFNSASLQ